MKTTLNSRQEAQRLVGGDALFVGGMVLVFSALSREFGLIGPSIGLLLVAAGACLSLLARRGPDVPVRVPASLNDLTQAPKRGTPHRYPMW